MAKDYRLVRAWDERLALIETGMEARIEALDIMVKGDNLRRKAKSIEERDAASELVWNGSCLYDIGAEFISKGANIWYDAIDLVYAEKGVISVMWNSNGSCIVNGETFRK